MESEDSVGGREAQSGGVISDRDLLCGHILITRGTCTMSRPPGIVYAVTSSVIRSGGMPGRSILRRSTHGWRFSTLWLCPPDPGDHNGHDYAETDDWKAHEQDDNETAGPTVEIPCREHTHTSRQRWFVSTGLDIFSLHPDRMLKQLPVQGRKAVRDKRGKSLIRHGPDRLSYEADRYEGRGFSRTAPRIRGVDLSIWRGIG